MSYDQRGLDNRNKIIRGQKNTIYKLICAICGLNKIKNGFLAYFRKVTLSLFMDSKRN